MKYMTKEWKDLSNPSAELDDRSSMQAKLNAANEYQPRKPSHTRAPRWASTSGKYQWGDAKKGGDSDQDMPGDAINATMYSWSGGGNIVSIYIEFEGLDGLLEGHVVVSP